MKALVTGAAGFIGSHLTDYLVNKGLSVCAIDDLSGGVRENVNPKADFHEKSILDVDFVNTLFAKERFDYVFHLAAYAAEGLSHFIKRFNYSNNLIGSINLINASVNAGTVKCFVFTSSIAVYGKNQTPMIESMAPIPEDPYGISKYAVELDLHASLALFGLNYVVFRPHNVYGERQNIGDPYRNVIGIFMNQILQGKPMTIFGDGGQSRAFSYISDVAPAIAESIFRPSSWNTVYNIGADTPYAVLTLANTVAKAMGVKPAILHLEPRNEVVTAFSSHEKAQRIFGDLAANVSLDEGVERMAKWVKQTGSRQGKPFNGIEITKNLPKSWARLSASPMQ